MTHGRTNGRTEGWRHKRTQRAALCAPVAPTPLQVLHYIGTVSDMVVQTHALFREAAVLCRYLELTHDRPRICLSGFSFGGSMAATAGATCALLLERPEHLSVVPYDTDSAWTRPAPPRRDRSVVRQ